MQVEVSPKRAGSRLISLSTLRADGGKMRLSSRMVSLAAASLVTPAGGDTLG